MQDAEIYDMSSKCMTPAAEVLIYGVQRQGWNCDVTAEAQTVFFYLPKNEAESRTLTGTSTEIMNSLHAIGN